MNIIEVLEQEQLRSDIPEFKAGDTVKVYCKIVEGTRERDGFDGFAQYIIDTYGEDALDDESLPENSVLTNYRTFKANAGAPDADGGQSCPRARPACKDSTNPAIRKMLGRR